MDHMTGYNLHDWSLESDVSDLHTFDDLKLDDVIASTVIDDDYRSRDCTQYVTQNLVVSNNSSSKDDVMDDVKLDDYLDDVMDNDEASMSESIELNPFDGLPYSSLYYELMEERHKLPVWKAKDDFVLAVEESPIVLVSGRPGSGKSTQIPQWCIHFAQETEFKFGSVLCAQPSPLSAMSLAIQVAREMDLTEVGGEVGYKIPHSNCTSDHTVLTFTTDEILLREMADDPLLHRYNFIIIDEIQERTLATDLLLALFKSIQHAREELKIIIISLPHEMDKLEEFFEEVPVLDLFYLEESEPTGSDVREEGSDEAERKRREEIELKRISSIDVIYLPTEQPSLCDVIVNLVMTLHCDQSISGDVIVFMATSQEIEEVCERVSREVAMKTLHGVAGEAHIVPLNHQMPVGAQQAVYDKKFSDSDDSPLKQRQVIICDDIAESLFSKSGISVVIDSGAKIETIFNSRTRTKCRLRKSISRRSAKLRTARCQKQGRVYRMYSEQDYQAMDDDTMPSIERVELSSHVLLLKRLLQRLNLSFTECQFIDPPDPEAYMLALEELDYHGALDETGNLSDLGAVMSEIPLPVPMAKCVIASCGEDCVQEALTIVSMATSPPLWSVPRGVEESASGVKRALADAAGDHFTLLNIFDQFVRHKRSESWCIKHFLNYNSLLSAEKTRAELLRIMEKLELPISAPIQDPRLMEISVKRAILAGYFMQVARDTDGCGNYLIIRDRHVARIHPNSSVKRSSEWIVYDQFLLTENSYVTMVSHVTPSWIVQVSPHSYLMNLPGHETKEFLLKLSARWRQRLADEHAEEGRPGRPERRSEGGGVAGGKQLDQQQRESLKQGQTVNGGSNGGLNGGEPTDNDDVDVLTQAARGMTYAYHQAADYVGKGDKEEGTQCVVQ